MKKIEKIFKNINISINEKHKEETKNKILEFYQPAKKSFNFYRPLKFAAFAAACLIIVSITVIQFYDKSGFHKEKSSPSLEDYEKIKSGEKESPDLSRGAIDESKKTETERKYFAEKRDLADKKTTTDDLAELKSEKKALMEPINEEAESQLMMKGPVTKIEQSKFVNFVKLESTYKKSYSAVKSVEVNKDEASEKNKSKRSEVRKKEEAAGTEFKDSNIKNETAAGNNFISTAVYNRISFQPNISVDSFLYLNSQLSQNLAVDLKNINDEEVINYFTRKDKAESREEIFVEGTLKSGDYYYFLINLEPKDYFIKDLSITFNSNISDFYIYGYNEDVGKIYEAPKNLIKNNHASIFLIMKILNLTQDIASIDITQSKNGSVTNIEQRIKPDSIKDINSADTKLKKAILAYMILSELKSAEFTKADIIEYKNKTLSKLPAELDTLYKNYINFKKN